MHSLIASRVEYCNAPLACASKATTDKLQRVLNATARVVSGTHKFDRGLSRLLNDELHCSSMFQSESCTSSASRTMYNCLHGQAPLYLSELCQPVTAVASRQHLRSATRLLLVVPRYRLEHLRPTGFLCGWSVFLEFPAGQLARS